MLDRFLLSYPEIEPSRLNDHNVSKETSDQVKGLYDRLAKLEMQDGVNGESVPGVVRLAPDSWEVFKQLVGELQDEANAPGFPARLQGVWSKLEAYLARLSLILAPCRVAERGGEERIETGDVLAASLLIEYFKSHARRVYVSQHGQDRSDLLVKNLAEFLREHGGTWKDEPNILYLELRNRGCETLPERPDELSKMVFAIAQSGSWLKADPGWKKNDEGQSRRAISLRFRNGVDGVVRVDQQTE